MIGQTISHYKILEKLGEGGMGIVYKAQDTKLDRIVALKFLPHNLTANEAEKSRFVQEARAAAILNHPHVCTIYRIDEYNGQQFIEMEYVDGETLRRKVPIQKIEEALRCAIQIGEALQEAHSKGIVHRDIKCENIMVNSKNQIKVMDFGLAKLKGSMKLTRTSSTVGTLAYMAPEQIQGGEVDARSDIFSYGVVIFEMFTGHTPFRGEHEASMMYSIMNEDPEQLVKYRPELSTDIQRIINRALEKDPEDRYQHADDMVSELRRVQKQSGRVTRTMQIESSPTMPATTKDQQSDRESVPRLKSKIKLIIGMISVAVIIGVAALYFLFNKQKAIDSLAILPFEDVSAAPEQEYLADGVTESIINNLTKISSLRVVPRSTVFRFKGKDMDLQDIGSKLKVNAILTGRITHRGQSLEVQVDLIDVDRQSQLWGNRYVSTASDLLTLQESITKDVSSKLGIGFSSETQEKLAKRYTDNTQAYQLYMQGRYYWNKRTAAALERAISYFNQAIALDSTFALAYSGLADSYIIQSQYAGIPTGITLPLTQRAVRRALELDNSLAEAHTTLAFSYFEQWKYEDAEREFKQSIALNPRYATTYHWYGIMLGRTGNPDRYLAVIKQALEIDPYSPIITLNMGVANLLLKQYDEALSYFKKCVEIDPSFAVGYGWMGLTYERMKNYRDALSPLQKAVELSGRSSECLSYIGYFYGRVGKRDEALKLIKENEDRYHAGTGAAYSIARIYAGLGEKEKVLELLEQDYRDHSTWINSLGSDYVWDDVRSDPRFVELTKKVGLVK
ncbi:MAG: protein kinase [Ignavibacteriae bacterium]|nr:protein kinase [Ignavibacteria bacterium]MBI3364543.1 protein kinase [Ignavibacteriota bacterium]